MLICMRICILIRVSFRNNIYIYLDINEISFANKMQIKNIITYKKMKISINKIKKCFLYIYKYISKICMYVHIHARVCVCICVYVDIQIFVILKKCIIFQTAS